MSLITAEELVRGLLIGTFGGAAGLCTVFVPGSPLWIVPAALAAGGCALTVPEVRAEAARGLAQLPAPLQPAQLTGTLRALPAQASGLVRGARTAQQARDAARAGKETPAPVRAPEAPAGELVTALDSTPHRLIIGHTRGGKTTLIHHMATQWAAAGERVLVGDPDAAPGLWPGCEVRGAGDDVASIGELLTIVDAEVTARRAARAQGVRQFAPLHLVIDEAQDVLPALEHGMELFEDVARRGGKLNIRMTVGVQDKQVKTLGLEGKSALLRNFQVADVLKNREGRRVAVLRDAETGAKVSMPIPALTDPETLITRRPSTATTTNLRPAAAPAFDPSDLLAGLLDTPVSARSNAEIRADENRIITSADNNNMSRIQVDTTAGGGVTVNVAQVTGVGRRATRGRGLDMKARRQRTSRYAQVRSLVAGGARFEDVYRAVRGNRNEVHAEFKRAKAEIAQVAP
jgi:hypothetical protein